MRLQEEYATGSGPCEGHDQITRITRKKANEESPHHEFGSLEASGNAEEFGDDIDIAPSP
jgi:hypothetical protein